MKVTTLIIPCLLFVLTGLLLPSCQKEEVIPIIDNPVPIDTVVVPPVVDTVIVVPPVDPVYLPASTMAADTGAYFNIVSGGYGTYGERINVENSKLNILRDTLFFFGRAYFPLSQSIAKSPLVTTSIRRTGSNGYTYYVDGKSEAKIFLSGGQMEVVITYYLDGQSWQSASVYYTAKPSTTILTRADYLGLYRGAITNYEGIGIWKTLTIEADSTTNGVWLKEIKRSGFINAQGQLELPPFDTDTLDMNGTPFIIYDAPTMTTLRGKALLFGIQHKAGQGSGPSFTDYKQYLFRKE
jgi:hypothetical protein